MGQPDGIRKPYTLQADEGWTYRFGGVDFILKSREVYGGNSAAVLEYVTRKGEEPGEHLHSTEDEMFFVLEGSLTFICGDESFHLEKGGFMFLPRGIPHNYRIEDENPVRLLVITTPVREEERAGWAGFVSDMENGQGKLVAKPHHEHE